ncbi:hypothetical protein [Saccharopolyspora taberi]|uniref:Uncharacterized protein n=1 Tax=Saccharopolyspora taberi TaxID=60895 RepID=A0ABN3V111_9PSEU
MPRIRSIKPEFFTSEVVAELTLRARLTWIGLWTHCDDEGRCKDNPRLIHAALYPLDPDVTADDVAADLAELAKRQRVVRYVVDGRAYLQVTNWKEHQKPNRPQGSKFPAPADGHVQDPAGQDASVSDHGVFTDDSVKDQCVVTGGVVEEGRGEGAEEKEGETRAGTRTTTRATRIPDDFEVTAEMIEWARQNTPLVGRTETDKFVDYWRGRSGQGATKRDWTATWRNWMRRAQEDAERRGPRRSAGSTTKDDRINALDAFLEDESGTHLRALPGGAA